MTVSHISKCIKCPGCYRKGTMIITIRKKTAEMQCEACNEVVSDRVPYPKHRVDDKGYTIPFHVGDIRSFWADDYDEWHGDS